VVDEGWWEIKIRNEADERVGITFRGKFSKVGTLTEIRSCQYTSRAETDQNYPKSPPIFNLIDPLNLSPGHVKALQRRLGEEAKARAKDGQEMIYEVCLSIAPDPPQRNEKELMGLAYPNCQSLD
jgi:hypothetical protein